MRDIDRLDPDFEVGSDPDREAIVKLTCEELHLIRYSLACLSEELHSDLSMVFAERRTSNEYEIENMEQMALDVALINGLKPRLLKIARSAALLPTVANLDVMN